MKNHTWFVWIFLQIYFCCYALSHGSKMSSLKRCKEKAPFHLCLGAAWVPGRLFCRALYECLICNCDLLSVCLLQCWRGNPGLCVSSASVLPPHPALALACPYLCKLQGVLCALLWHLTHVERPQRVDRSWLFGNDTTSHVHIWWQCQMWI